MDSLYEPGALHLVYVDLDRTVVGHRGANGEARFPCRRIPICARSTLPSDASWEP